MISLKSSFAALVFLVGSALSLKAGGLVDTVLYFEPGLKPNPGFLNPQAALVASSDPTSPQGIVTLGQWSDDPLTGTGKPVGLLLGWSTSIPNGSGPDIRIMGNAFQGFHEPGYVEVARETSSSGATPDGWMDETFYLIRPSNYNVLPHDPRSAAIPLTFPLASPEWDFPLTGYADVGVQGDLIDLDDAIDTEGNPVILSDIAYIRIRTITDSTLPGQLGDYTTEINYVESTQGWTVLRLPDLVVDPTNPNHFGGTAFDHLSDGRLVYINNETHYQQDTWGGTSLTTYASPPVVDPSFLAIRDDDVAVVGAGGGFGTPSNLYRFDPSDTASPGFSPIASLQNFDGVFWKTASMPNGGIIVSGQTGTESKSALEFVSLDGSVKKLIVDNISVYSAAVTVDSEGNVFASNNDDLTVYRFEAADIESAISGSTPLTLTNGTPLHTFSVSGDLAIDGLGRIWATGWQLQRLQVFDPKTGARADIDPGVSEFNIDESSLQIASFSKNGESYISFLAKDQFWFDGTPVHYGYQLVSNLVIPNKIEWWRTVFFSAQELGDTSLESTLWGNAADPDLDGLTNLYEYAFGLDPLSPDSNVIKHQITDGQFRILFPRIPENQDLTYIVESSETLAPGSWNEVARSQTGNATVSSGTGSLFIIEEKSGRSVEVTVSDSSPISSKDRAFMRVRVEIAAP